MELAEPDEDDILSSVDAVDNDEAAEDGSDQVASPEHVPEASGDNEVEDENASAASE